MAPDDDHRHCKVCGKVTGPDKDVCSKACREKREASTTTRRRYTNVLYALVIFTVVLLVLYSVHL